MTSEKTPVETEFESIQVIRNPYLQQVIYILPFAISLFLLIDWLLASGKIGFAKDLIRWSLSIGYIVEFLLVNRLFVQLPVALKTIWERGLLNSKSGSSSTEKDFLNYLDSLETALNSKASLLSGIVFILVSLITTFPFVIWLRGGPFEAERFIIFELSFGFLFGLVAWRIFVIAFYIYKLGGQFKISILSNHRDRCGGLKPLGDLCLSNAFVILVPIIILSVWLIRGTQPGGELYEIVWGDRFRLWLLALVVMSIFVFFLPLYNIHKQMERESLEIERELDELSAKSEKISHRLRVDSDTIDLDDGNKLLKRLEYFSKIQESNRKTPKWPFDLNIILKFSVAQIVPVLSLLGINEPISIIIENIKELIP